MASVLKQGFYAAIVCCVAFGQAIIITWPSSTLKLFGSVDTPLNRPMTKLELYLLGSISSITAVITTPLAGYLLDKIGRKYCNMLTALAYLIFWLMLAVSSRVELVLAGLLISGFGGSMFLVVPIFISEISQESIRGALTSAASIFFSTGILASYLLGGILEYNTMVYSCLAMSSVVVLLLGFLKESPVFLIKIGRDEEAVKSLLFYRGIKIGSKEMSHEIESIRRTLNPEFNGASEEQEKLKPEKSPVKLSTWQFFKKSKATRRGFAIVLVLYTMSFFQGLLVFQVYAGPIFAEAAPNMSRTFCSSLLAIVNIFSGFVASYFIEKFGRKGLMMFSSVSASMCCVLLGSQLHLHWGSSPVTLVLICLCCAVLVLGPGTVPPVLRTEVFHPEVSSIMAMLVVEYAWTLNFFVLFIFNPLIETIGLGPVFYIFATGNFAAVVFCAFFVPETKGLSNDTIQLLLVNKKRNVSNGV